MNSYLSQFDGVASNIVFCMWTGTNQMSNRRIQALWTIFNNIRCPIVFLNHLTFRDWELPDHPFHPALEYLSETHKSDYLRCYLMHHFGGGYTDLKLTSKSWSPFFEKLRNSGKYALGYTEIGPHGIPHVEGPYGDEIRSNYKDTIGLCAFIFKKQTELTHAWYQQTVRILDDKLEALKQNPARHPQDQFGARFEDGTFSTYPIKWAQILGEIFHPLVYQQKTTILHDDIAPIFYNYR